MSNFETAQTLDEAFVYATEVNLATLEDLLMVKKTSKSKVRRQRGICLGMLRVCASSHFNSSAVRWGHDQHRSFPRVSDLLKSSEPEALEGALDRLIQKFQGAGVATPPGPPPA